MADEALSDWTVKPLRTASGLPFRSVIVTSLSISSEVADTTRTCTVMRGSGEPNTALCRIRVGRYVPALASPVPKVVPNRA